MGFSFFKKNASFQLLLMTDDGYGTEVKNGLNMILRIMNKLHWYHFYFCS